MLAVNSEKIGARHLPHEAKKRGARRRERDRDSRWPRAIALVEAAIDGRRAVTTQPTSRVADDGTEELSTDVEQALEPTTDDEPIAAHAGRRSRSDDARRARTTGSGVLSTVTVWAVARRPRWIGALVLALAIAAGFAALGQWQLVAQRRERRAAARTQTETVVPLDDDRDAAAAGAPTRATGQLVTSTATFVPERLRRARPTASTAPRPGYWVVGHCDRRRRRERSPWRSGWAATADAAACRDPRPAAIAARPTHRPAATCRSESPQEIDFENGRRSARRGRRAHQRVADAARRRLRRLPRRATTAPAGLDAIDSPAPITDVSLNWLNIFYAIEWVIFAGFAIFLWYRLVKDAWEEETRRKRAGADRRIEACRHRTPARRCSPDPAALTVYQVSSIITGTLPAAARAHDGAALRIIGVDIELGGPYGFLALHAARSSSSASTSRPRILIVHGWFYVLYLFCDFLLWSRMRWSFGRSSSSRSAASSRCSRSSSSAASPREALEPPIAHLEAEPRTQP